MGPALYFIAIMACGEGNAPCEQVRVAETRYETEAACTAATEETLMRNDDLPYPLVVAECRTAGATPARLVPADVLMPEPQTLPRLRTASAQARPTRG